MMKFVLPLLLGSLVSFAAHAADSAYETARKAKLAQSKDFVQVMDEATPDELAALFNLNDDDDSQDFSSLIDQTAYAGVVRIDVSIATQSLTIQSPSGGFSTVISSARPGYFTARGCYGRPRLEVMHYSHKYHNSPMPHSMFYRGGFAIHGTYEVNHLGRPASHGCVRVSPAAAAELYSIVQSYGAANTVICVH